MRFDDRQLTMDKTYAVLHHGYDGIFTDEQVGDLYDISFLSKHLLSALKRMSEPAAAAVDLVPSDLTMTFAAFSDDVNCTVEALSMLCASVERAIDMEPYNEWPFNY